jgi:hypothetical protein
VLISVGRYVKVAADLPRLSFRLPDTDAVHTAIESTNPGRLSDSA